MDEIDRLNKVLALVGQDFRSLERSAGRKIEFLEKGTEKVQGVDRCDEIDLEMWSEAM